MSEIVLRFDTSQAPGADSGLVLSNAEGNQYRVGYDGYSDRRRAGDNSFSAKFADRIHRAPRETGGDIIEMRLFLDVSSAELFADGGATVMTDIFFPASSYDGAALYSNQPGVTLIDGEIVQLNGIW